MEPKNAGWERRTALDEVGAVHLDAFDEVGSRDGVNASKYQVEEVKAERYLGGDAGQRYGFRIRLQSVSAQKRPATDQRREIFRQEVPMRRVKLHSLPSCFFRHHCSSDEPLHYAQPFIVR